VRALAGSHRAVFDGRLSVIEKAADQVTRESGRQCVGLDRGSEPRGSAIPPKVKVLYIAGVSRSGTTLLECMLNGLTGVCGAGEVTHIWDRGFSRNELCGCGEPFHQCEFWSQIKKDAFESEDFDYRTTRDLRSYVCAYHHLPQLLIPELRSELFESRLRAYSGRLVRIYQSIQRISGARLITDSSKYPSELFLLGAMDQIELRVVHVVRNVKAVVYAWQKRKQRPDVHWKKEYFSRYPFYQTALAWNVFNLLIAMFESRDVPYIRVHYEELIREPKATLAAICRVADVAAHDLDFGEDHTVYLGDNHTVSGNPVRFQRGPITLKVDDEWENRARPVHRWLVDLMTFPLQRRYGYL